MKRTIQVIGKQLVTLPLTPMIEVTGKTTIYILPVTSMVAVGCCGNALKGRTLHTKPIYARSPGVGLKQIGTH